MSAQIYIDALAEAQRELEEVESQIAPLQDRKQRLDLIIKALSPERESMQPSPANPFLVSAATDKSPPLWATLRDLLRDSSGFTTKDGARVIEDHIEASLGPNRNQIIRNALTRHPETFVKISEGRWRVRDLQTQWANFSIQAKEVPEGTS